MKYNLKEPRYLVDQYVDFRHHNGRMMVGKIVSIETHYGRKVEDMIPYGFHIYLVVTPSSKRRGVWIGEKEIKRVIL